MIHSPHKTASWIRRPGLRQLKDELVKFRHCEARRVSHGPVRLRTCFMVVCWIMVVPSVRCLLHGCSMSFFGGFSGHRRIKKYQKMDQSKAIHRNPGWISPWIFHLSTRGPSWMPGIDSSRSQVSISAAWPKNAQRTVREWQMFHARDCQRACV